MADVIEYLGPLEEKSKKKSEEPGIEYLGPLEPSFTRKVGQRVVGGLRGTVEAALSLGTGFAAFPAGMIAEAGALISPPKPVLPEKQTITGPEGVSFEMPTGETPPLYPSHIPVQPTPLESREAVMSALTYEPRTEPGRVLTGIAAKPFEALFYPAQKAREFVTEKYGPRSGSVAGLAGEVLTLAAIPGAKKGLRAWGEMKGAAKLFDPSGKVEKVKEALAKPEAERTSGDRLVLREPELEKQIARMQENEPGPSPPTIISGEGKTAPERLDILKKELFPEEKPSPVVQPPATAPPSVVPTTPPSAEVSSRPTELPRAKEPIESPTPAVAQKPPWDLTPEDLVESRTREEIQQKLESIFGRYEELTRIEEEGLPKNRVEKKRFFLAEKFMAELERAVVDRDYAETGEILAEVKKHLKPKEYPIFEGEVPIPVGVTPETVPDFKSAVIKDTGKFPVQLTEVSKIKTKASELQFKLDVNAEGIQKPLSGEWDPLAAGNVLLWQAKDGSLYVANGHHRVAFAKQTEQKTVNAQILKESEGFTINDARRMAAETNIKEGKGTIYDHAEYFRLNPEYTEELTKRKGISGQGYIIGKSATDNTYAQFRNRKISPDAAEAIASAAPHNDTLQIAGVKYALDYPKADPYEIQSFVNALKVSTEPMIEQANLFGFNDRAIRDAEKQAKAVAQKIQGLREQINAVRGAANRPEIAARMGVDVKDPEGVKKKVSDLNREIENWKKWFMKEDLVKQVRTETGTQRIAEERVGYPSALNSVEIKTLDLSKDQARILERVRKEEPENYLKLLRSYGEVARAKKEEVLKGKSQKMKQEGLFGVPRPPEAPGRVEISPERQTYLDGLTEKVKSLDVYGRIPIEKLPTAEQQYLISKGVTFDVDRMGKPVIGYSREKIAQDLREKVAGKAQKTLLEEKAPYAPELKAGDFVTFLDETGKEQKGKVRDYDAYSKKALIFPADRSLIKDRAMASIEVPLDRIIRHAKEKRVPYEEGKLAEEINKAQVGVYKPTGKVEIGAPEPGPRFKFENADTEARFEAAKGIEKKPLWERTKAFLVSLKHKATREYEHLPRTAEFAQLRFDLLNLAKEKGISADKALRTIRAITVELKDQYTTDIYRRKVILDDLLATVEKGKGIPFGFTKESLQSELSRLDAEIATRPEITEALKKRKDFWDALKKDYIDSLSDIGFDVSERLTNENYFRHQVLDYAQLKSVYGAGKKLKTPTGRGFLKERRGSELDINTDYLQAESEVMAQMIHDVKLAKVIKSVDSNYNIADSLKPIAREKNFERIVGGPENVRRIRKLETELAELRSGEEPMDSAMKGRAKEISEELFSLDPTRPFKQRIAIGFNKLEKLDVVIENVSELGTLAKEGGEIGLTARGILKAITDRESFIADTLKKDYLQWKFRVDDRLLPEGHSKWQPREGSVFYFADTIPAALAEQLKSGALEQVGISGDLLKQVLAIGRKRKEFILKDSIIETLDNLSPHKGDNVVSQASRGLLKAWKVWTLISPRRLAKYNIRNLTGDADAVFVGNRSTFKKTPQATKELYDVFVGDKPMTPEMKEWFDRGGMQSTLQFQEMGDINQLKIFKNFLDKQKNLADIPKDLWNKYWTSARMTTDFRESILRYASYLDFLEQTSKAPGGKPKSFGASIPEEIMGLKDVRDRAYWLSNDLLGAYDRISVMGQYVREHLFPFWSWKELNFKRYIQFARNAADNGEIASAVGRKALAVSASPYTYIKVGSFLLKATAFWSALQAWNNTMFPDLEKGMPSEERNRPHIILGKTDEGKIINFTRIGALGDFLQWFGLDAAPKYVDSWMQGKMTLKEIAYDMAKSPLNALVQGMTPFAKTPAEIITRRGLFPDVTRPGTIRDRWEHVARSLGLQDEYKAISGKPSEGYYKSLNKFLVYETDPMQSAYHEINELKRNFLKKLGKEVEGFWLTPRGNALYDIKLSMRYGDEKAFREAIAEYKMRGGTAEGFTHSLQMMHPLSGLNKDEATAFASTLKADDRERLINAYKFYKNVLSATAFKKKKES